MAPLVREGGEECCLVKVQFGLLLHDYIGINLYFVTIAYLNRLMRPVYRYFNIRMRNPIATLTSFGFVNIHITFGFITTYNQFF